VDVRGRGPEGVAVTGIEAALVRQLASPAMVMVSRENGGWVAEIAALGVVRRAPALATVDAQVRDLLGTDHVDYEFRTGDFAVDRLVKGICPGGLALELPSGGTFLDLAVLLGMPEDQMRQALVRHHHGEGTAGGVAEALVAAFLDARSA
jgi:hypothetical protein